eukprot:SAG31_NODE_9208_length_1316_cov_1.365653_1_plen_46_part_10
MTSSGRVYWATPDPDVFMRVNDHHNQAIHSAAACAIKNMDIFTSLS